MECKRFERFLEDSFEVTLSEQNQASLADHLKRCPSCRQYRSILRGETNLLARHDQEYLTRSVLDSTSGPSCASAEELLCLDDGEASREGQRLLAAHLENCSHCSAMKAWLDEAKDVWPALSELDPGEGFTASVLLATSHSPAPPPSWIANLGRSVGQLLQRPRFSWEAAYVGTLLLIALVGNPADVLRPEGETRWSRAADIAPGQVTHLVGSVKTGLEQQYATSLAKVDLAEETFRGLLERSTTFLGAGLEIAEKTEAAIRQVAGASIRLISGDIPGQMQEGQPAEVPDGESEEGRIPMRPNL
jgi:hypothetical protein